MRLSENSGKWIEIIFIIRFYETLIIIKRMYVCECYMCAFSTIEFFILNKYFTYLHKPFEIEPFFSERVVKLLLL